MFRVLHLHHAPWILSATNFLASHLHHGIGSTYGKGDTLSQLGHLQFIFLILVTVHIWQLINSDASSMQLLNNTRFEFLDLSHGETVRLGNDRDNVHLVTQLLHEVNV